MPHRKLNGLLLRRSSRFYSNKPHPVAAGATIVLAALAISAVVNRFAAKKAERDNPPIGKFVDVGGLLLHYVEHGTGEPLVLLHGNAGMIQDLLRVVLSTKRPENIGSSFLIGPALVTANARAAPLGPTKPRPN
jgi:hypothetical protein